MPNRYHQHELWDPPPDKLPPEPHVFGSFVNDSHEVDNDDLWDVDEFPPEPEAICDRRPSDDEDYDHELQSLTRPGRSKFSSSAAEGSTPSGSCCFPCRILCGLFVLALGALACLSKARLLAATDAADLWDGARPGVPVVLQQDGGFLSVGAFADTGVTDIEVMPATSNSSIWIPLAVGNGKWRFRSQSLVRISAGATHWVDGRGYWYLGQDCHARNWGAETELFTLTQLPDGGFSFEELATGCGGKLGVKPYKDCQAIVKACLRRCEAKYGQSIAEGSARYCAKGCAETKGSRVVSPEAYCYIGRRYRESTCMDRCENIVEKAKMVPKCQFGCGFWGMS